ncbi:MAG: thiolase family protein [Desulfobacterales bacterium]|nr:thiolase family protein [Desulfobacterales bacterium]
MSRRVAVCATAQIKNEPDIWYQRFQGMLLDCFESILSQTGVTFDMEKGIRNVVTCSDDVFDARTISDNGMTDVVGAHFRGEEKTAQNGINALGYAMAAILSGHDDLVLVMGHGKESQPESRQMCTNLAFDPFYCRPLGLDYLNASAFQARAYMEKAGITEEQLAKVVVRSRRMGAKNPYARENDLVSEEAVMQSPLMSDPIRELHTYPLTDWAVGMLLCCEERAHEFTDNPVWISGFGSCMDSYFLGDRDLSDNFALKQAAARAYQMAGIKDPKTAFDVVELNDAYAYQLPMWAEGIGLVDAGSGGRWIDDGGLEADHVNTSGGMLNGNPIMLGGLARALEGVHQLQGSAGDRQVEGAKKALAHGTTGAAGQHHGVLILEK